MESTTNSSREKSATAPEETSSYTVAELRHGYLAAIKQPASAEVQKLVADVNAKRRAQFQRTAKSNNISVAQVSNRFYELAVQKTRPGHYYQDKSGSWKKK